MNLYKAECEAEVFLQSDDLEQQRSGLAYMEWEAEHFPDLSRAVRITDSAEQLGRHAERRDLAASCFAVSIVHFRTVAQAEGFEATPDFFEAFNNMVTNMDAAKHKTLRSTTLLEFAPLAINAAQNYSPSEEVRTAATEWDWEKYQLDETLYAVGSELRASNPVLAQQARSLITDRTWSVFSEAFEVDHQLLETFLAGDMQIASTILETRGSLMQPLWGPMRDRILDGGPDDIEWAEQVIETILVAQPDYFRDHDSDDAIDLLLDRNVGVIIGLLGRTDIISDLTGEQREHTLRGSTVAGVAWGLGYTSNTQALQHLFGRVADLSEDVEKHLISCFESGLQAAAIKATAAPN